MDKLKCFLSLFITCLILTSFISCVNAQSNINETINDNKIIVTDIINNETINDTMNIINNESNNNEIIIPTVINNTENITVIEDKKHINVTDDLNNYDINSNSNSNSNNVLIKNNNNDLIKVNLNDTDNNNNNNNNYEDLIYVGHGMNFGLFVVGLIIFSLMG